MVCCVHVGPRSADGEAVWFKVWPVEYWHYRLSVSHWQGTFLCECDLATVRMFASSFILGIDSYSIEEVLWDSEDFGTRVGVARAVLHVSVNKRCFVVGLMILFHWSYKIFWDICFTETPATEFHSVWCSLVTVGCSVVSLWLSIAAEFFSHPFLAEKRKAICKAFSSISVCISHSWYSRALWLIQYWVGVDCFLSFPFQQQTWSPIVYRRWLQ